MNFTIPATDLRRMVERLKPCRGPQWFGQFRCVGDSLEITTTGETVSADVLSACIWNDYGNSDNSSPVALPLARLEAWLSGVSGEVRATRKDDFVLFETDDASLPLPIVPGYEPVLPAVPSAALPLSAEVWPALQRVSWAAGKVDGQRPDFRSMLHVAEGMVWASDTYRAAVVHLPELDATASFWPDLAGVLDAVDLTTAQVTIDRERRVHLADDGGRYVVPTYSGTDVPPPGQIDAMLQLNAKDASPVTVNRKELVDALGRQKPLMAPDSGKVWLSAEGGEMRLTVVTPDDQPATREIPCGSEGATVCFKLHVLSSVLRSLDGEEVTLLVATGSQPVTLHEGAYSAMLAPIREGAPARARRKAPKAPRF